YSDLTVDPSDNVTFWGTNEYDSASFQTTRIFSFKLLTCNLSVTTSSPSLICNQGTAIATPSGTSPYTYSWSPSGGTKDTASNLSSGTYKCVVTDGIGCKDSANQVVTVTTTPTVTVSGKTTMCYGDTSKLSTAGTTTYTWSPNTGLSSTTGATVIANPTVTVTYTVTGQSGACNNTSTIVITVNPTPTLLLTGKTAICKGITDTLTASGGTYAWSTGAATSNIMVSPATTSTYTLAVSNGTCIKDTSLIVTVNSYPTVTLTGKTAICKGITDTLTASGGISYTWNTGSTATTITVNPTTTTTYTLGVSNSSCTKDTSLVVTVNSYPAVTFSGKSAICQGMADTITANGGTSYTWSTGGIYDTIMIHPASATTYTVVVSNGKCIKDTSIGIALNPIPTITVTGDTIICLGSNTILTASGAMTYVWPAGQTTAAINVSPATSTTYTVTGTNANGCTNTITERITVVPGNGFDLSGNLQVCVDTPSFNSASIQACIFNNRCMPVNGTLKLVLDTALHFTNSVADSTAKVSGDTLIWNYDSLSDISLTRCLNLNGTISNLPPGDSVSVSMFITPTVGDSNPANNSVTYWVKAFPYNCVGLPFDPNEKSVSPIGDISPTQLLTYTIHFQNTGTAVAHNVVVIDTLSSKLDATTLKVLSSSSDVTTQVISGHIIKFIFNNINLPDTATSKTTSIGVFTFTIKPMSPVAAGDKIVNNAGIYFDANPAIITNKTVNTIAGTPLFIQNLSSSFNIACFPNPFSTSTSIVFNTDGKHYLELDDITGRKIETLECTGRQYELQRNNLASGVYFIKAFDADKGFVATNKLVVQ
ncbi:MAG TPA: T9SS type A sorting domain-containing protein, partial [Bacteroidia bacterium]|nr:T9SS type A sorting domain-containing protein [Bacteroidia bacterium]